MQDKKICLTGDIHHKSLKTNDQKIMDIDESEASIEYVRIANEYNLQITLFITGKTAVNEIKNIREIVKYSNVEIGGHDFYANSPKIIYYGLFKRIFNTMNGPSFFQNHEIKKTKLAFNSIYNLSISSWRNHGYRQDCNTYRLLYRNGIEKVSNEVNHNIKINKYYPEKVYASLVSVPINVLPDHDHIIHSDIGKNDNKYDLKTYDIEKWFKIIKCQINEIVSCGGIATILIHPACMYLVDKYYTFRKICEYFSYFKTIKMSSIKI